MHKIFVFLSILLAITGTAFATGRTSLVAGGTGGGETHLNEPFSVCFDRDGTLVGVEFLKGNRLFKIDPDSGTLTFIGGVYAQTSSKDGDLGADDGPDPLKAHFNGMHDLAIARNGDIYLADTFNNRVRKIDKETGKLSTIAGTGKAGFSGDGGPAVKAKVGGVYSCSLNKDETRLYIADLKNRRIRVIDLKSNIISTVAGNGNKGTPLDGAVATATPLAGPRAVAVDDDENVYIVSREGHALRVVGRDGKISTVVNASGKKGYAGDGGNALMAKLNGPKHACIDHDGNVIIADTENHVIRKYVPKEGKIYLLAGVPKKHGDKLSSVATDSELRRPHGVRVDAKGDIYISDSGNNRVLCLKP